MILWPSLQEIVNKCRQCKRLRRILYTLFGLFGVPPIFECALRLAMISLRPLSFLFIEDICYPLDHPRAVKLGFWEVAQDSTHSACKNLQQWWVFIVHSHVKASSMNKSPGQCNNNRDGATVRRTAVVIFVKIPWWLARFNKNQNRMLSVQIQITKLSIATSWILPEITIKKEDFDSCQVALCFRWDVPAPW